MTRKVCAVITARPSYSRIRSALTAIVNHPELELQLVVGGSALLDRYGEVVEQVKRDGFSIDAEVYMVVEGANPVASAKSTGLGLVELASIFHGLEPDVVITVADRYETLATAVAASYLNIPVAHVQGGEITGSIDEKVRHAVTKLSNLHFVSTKKALERVTRMGEEPQTVFMTGCPSIDIAAKVSQTKGPEIRPIRKIRRRGTGTGSVDWLPGRTSASCDNGVRRGPPAGDGDLAGGSPAWHTDAVVLAQR